MPELLYPKRLNAYLPLRPVPEDALVTVTLRDAVAVLAGELESVTVTEKVKVPAAVGVPVSTPELLNANHPGMDVPAHE
jgi:hypothetical protein